MSLHHRITALIVSIVMAVFLALGYTAWHAVSQAIERALQGQQVMATVFARHLDELVEHAQAHLVVLAGELAEQDGGLDGGVDWEPVKRALDQSYAQFGLFFFRHLLVFDRYGQLVASAPPAEAVGLDAETGSLLGQAMQTGRSAVSNVVYLPVENAAGILFVAPIGAKGGRSGALAAEMRLPYTAISNVAAEFKLGRTGHVEVMDTTGRVIASTYPEHVGQMTEHPDFYPPLLVARRSRVGAARVSHETIGSDAPYGETHITAFVPLASAPWGVGVEQHEGETFAAVWELRDRALVVAGIALVVTLGCASIGTRSIVQPILALTRAGERMATGDLSEPIRVPGPDEVGRLARVLETMRQRLGQSVAEITAWNHELEQRVQERTAEIARLSEARARLDAAQRLEVLRAEFLASVSHELRTPLGFIKGYTTTLLRDDVTWQPPQQREFLGVIDEECDRLGELINSLLDAARVQAGRLELHCRPLAVEPVLRRSADRLAAWLNGHRVVFDLQASPTITADEARLEQVLVNLLQNAIKYSPTGGTIDVRLEVETQGVRIGVLDRGVGVPREETARIFEPFYRVRHRTTDHRRPTTDDQGGAVVGGRSSVVAGETAAGTAGGAGLGLAVSRAIVEAHGGRIWVEPRAGGGTAVYLTLPWRARPTEAAEGVIDAPAARVGS